MSIDYQKLCKEIFNTDDENELRNIAKALSTKNPRNAGRKKKINQTDIKEIKKRLANGESFDSIAKKYKTSRQIISKSIDRKCDKEFPMQIMYMYGNKVCTMIYVNFSEEKIEIENRTNDIMHRAFGVKEKPSWQDFQIFLSDRCFPSSRCGAKTILKGLGVDSYDTLQIVEKTAGRLSDDNMHLKFKYLNRREQYGTV